MSFLRNDTLRQSHEDMLGWSHDPSEGLPQEETIRPTESIEFLDYEKVTAIIEDAHRFGIGLCSCRNEIFHNGEKECDVPDQERFLREVHALLKPGAYFLLVEPLGHVSRKGFDKTLTLACQAGFRHVAAPKVGLSRAALFTRF